MVPVSVRNDGQEGQLGNRVSSYFVDLPVGEGNAVMRLHQVSFAMRGHKDSGQSVGADAIVQLSGFAPPTLHSLGARVASSFTRRLFNVVVTNVPGPQFPLYAAGARMLEMYPVVPLAKGQALSIGLTSYDGGVYYGLNADRDAMADVDVLAGLIEESLAELVGTADRVTTGLVLGAGGVLGAAWTIGALAALQQERELDPREAEVLVGTCAGSVLAGFLGCGIGVDVLLDHQRGIVNAEAPDISYDPRPRLRRRAAPAAAPGHRLAARRHQHARCGRGRSRRWARCPPCCRRAAARSRRSAGCVDAVCPKGAWAGHPQHLDRRDGLRQRPPRRLRPRRRPARRAARRGHGVLRHPRLVRAGADRRTPVRRRRRLLADVGRPGAPARAGRGGRAVADDLARLRRADHGRRQARAPLPPPRHQAGRRGGQEGRRAPARR